ncbi:MAG: aminopeptidase [Pirellulales bacterium]
MHDPRIARLAEILIDHSCHLQQGQKLLIEATDLPDAMLVKELIEQAARLGAHPLVTWKQNSVLRSLYRHGSETSLALAGECEAYRMRQVDAYIGIRGTANSSMFADVPAEKMELYQKKWWHPVHSELRVPHTRWVVLRYPTDGMAQAAEMSSQAFEDFFFQVCTADYQQMGRDQQPLARRMEAADSVRLVGPNTDLRFSIRGIPVVPCYGQCNIPDGEVFTAPVRDSVEGTIRFNAPSRYQGTVFQQVEFEFQRGRIVKASCSGNNDRLNRILDSDEGARQIGEWSVGCNNRVLHPMLDTLFDEKIGGSIHLTPGNAYDEADNGNRSCIHWDLVLIQRADYGGGELWLDDTLIRKNGLFVPDDLAGLNVGLE